MRGPVLSSLHTWLVLLAACGVLAHPHDPPATASRRNSGPGPFKLIVSPAHVTRGFTHMVNLRCEPDRSFGSNMASLHWLRILKKTREGGWSLVGQHRAVVGTETNLDQVTVDGNLGTDLGEAYLQVNWPIADQNIFGVYVCDAFGVDEKLQFVIEKSLELSISEHNVTAQAILDLLLESHAEVKKDTDEIAEDVQDNTSLLDSLLARIIELERQMKEHVHDVSRTDTVSPNSSVSWPGGHFGLLKPESGCPSGPGFSNPSPSFVKFHTESLSNATCDSHRPDFHISNPLITRTNTECFVNLRFCEASGVSSATPWPEGTYCVNWNINHPCPPRFQPGRVVLDQVDGTEYHTADSRVVELSGTYTYLHFCCKESLPHDMAVSLPTDRPFYLYRYGGTCQKVQGMQVRPEYIDIRTEDRINGDDGHGLHADVVISAGEPTRIELCYYSKDQ